MTNFKNDMIFCIKCRKKNFIKVGAFEAGYFNCSHCSHHNKLSAYIYNERILEKLPHVGLLVSMKDSAERYVLKVGKNVLGVGEMADVILNRVMHNGKCFISRRHCTLTVSFDNRNGRLNYLLEDGAPDPITNEHKASLNYTFYKEKRIDRDESVYVADNGLINLGGEDTFRLEHVIIPEGTLDAYKISQRIKDGGTT